MSSKYKVHDFSKISFNIPTPDLLDIQIASWKDFLQEDVLPEKRANKGLQASLNNTFLKYSREILKHAFGNAFSTRVTSGI